jgi:hypothetical protein
MQKIPLTTVLGGLILTNGVTNANLNSMVEIIFVFERDYFLRDGGARRFKGITIQAITTFSRMVGSSLYC